MLSIPTHERLIVALDVPNADEAVALIDTLDTAVSFYKIGLELCMSGDYFHLIAHLKSRGKKVFTDLKFFDIPQTVASAVANLSKYGADFCTVHGDQAVVEAAARHKGKMKILAVTVLTSMNDRDLAQMGYKDNVSDTVLSRARYSLSAGADGVIASGHEASLLRGALGNDFYIVTPGIRLDPTEGTLHDQKRVMSIEVAFKSGASHIVMGRPIRDALDPKACAEIIQSRIHTAIEK